MMQLWRKSKKINRFYCGWEHLPEHSLASCRDREVPGVQAARVLCGAQDARITRQPCDLTLIKKRGVRPVALRPTLSDGLPLSGSIHYRL